MRMLVLSLSQRSAGRQTGRLAVCTCVLTFGETFAGNRMVGEVCKGLVLSSLDMFHWAFVSVSSLSSGGSAGCGVNDHWCTSFCACITSNKRVAKAFAWIQNKSNDQADVTKAMSRIYLCISSIGGQIPTWIAHVSISTLWRGSRGLVYWFSFGLASHSRRHHHHYNYNHRYRFHCHRHYHYDRHYHNHYSTTFTVTITTAIVVIILIIILVIIMGLFIILLFFICVSPVCSVWQIVGKAQQKGARNAPSWSCRFLCSLLFVFWMPETCLVCCQTCSWVFLWEALFFQSVLLLHIGCPQLFSTGFTQVCVWFYGQSEEVESLLSETSCLGWLKPRRWCPELCFWNFALKQAAGSCLSIAPGFIHQDWLNSLL